MRTFWQLRQLSLDKRKKIQDNKLRQMLLGAYAPQEPALMQWISNFLEKEEKYPLEMIHRIIDRLSSMSMSTTVVTYDEVQDYIKTMPDEFVIAKGPCACRLHTADKLGPDAMDLKAGKLELCRQSPLNVDIQIAASGEAFGELEDYEFITKEELLELEEKCHNLGLVSNVYMVLGGESGICHCSSNTCVPLIANKYIDGKTTVVKKGEFVSKTDMNICNGTGSCSKVCHFNARKIKTIEGRCVLSVDMSKCYGCGLCVDVCPEHAVTMIQRRKKKSWQKKLEDLDD